MYTQNLPIHFAIPDAAGNAAAYTASIAVQSKEIDADGYIIQPATARVIIAAIGPDLAWLVVDRWQHQLPSLLTMARAVYDLAAPTIRANTARAAAHVDIAEVEIAPQAGGPAANYRQRIYKDRDSN